MSELSGGRAVQGSLFAAFPTASEGPTPSGDAEAASSGRQEDRARQVRTILFTAPLCYLEMNKLRRGESWGSYDLYTLQLDAIQTVVDHMGFLEGGISRLALNETLAELARAMTPGRDPAEHEEVARSVIDWLLNAEDWDVYAPSYVTPEAGGTLLRRQAVVEILRERQEPDGRLVLRASVEAINLLLGSLNEDIADAQRAGERLLEDYIAVGRYDKAVGQAKKARWRSIQYAEQIGRWLRNARQDLSLLDWAGSIREEMDAALAHVRERLDDEARMREQIEEKLSGLEDSDRLATAVEVILLIKDCLRRHAELHGLLLDAGPTFRFEQEHQRFARPVGARHIDLRQGMEGILRAPLVMTGVANPTEVFFRALMGPLPPSVLNLARLVAELSAPGRDSAAEAPEIAEPVLVEANPAARFPPEAAEAAGRVLSSALAGPRRLSALLDESRRQAVAHPELAAELIRLRVLEAFARETREGDHSGAGLASESDGGALADPSYRGDDLLVGREVDLAEQRAPSAGEEEVPQDPERRPGCP